MLIGHHKKVYTLPQDFEYSLGKGAVLVLARSLIEAGYILYIDEILTFFLQKLKVYHKSRGFDKIARFFEKKVLHAIFKAVRFGRLSDFV